jgi:uncharacterized protein (TIGR02466 family)
MLKKKLIMSEIHINNIFPTPVYTSRLDRKLTEEELLFIDKNKLNINRNENNTVSNDNYILNNKEFKNLKEELDLRVQDYFNKIISPIDGITPYVTQSWLNYTEKNQSHHQHEHPNSIISGVFYIKCNKNIDSIKFINKKYDSIKIEVKEYNIWNSKSVSLLVKTGDIILFPSWLTHMVETNQEDDTRISLAFNVFVKGTLGKAISLTELKL